MVFRYGWGSSLRQYWCEYGVLPTKGLTLPLMSYGGSSLVIVCVAIGLLLRVDLETRQPEKASARVKR